MTLIKVKTQCEVLLTVQVSVAYRIVAVEKHLCKLEQAAKPKVGREKGYNCEVSSDVK